MATHDVTNQVPPLADYDVASSDVALTDGLERWGSGPTERIRSLGALAGTAGAQDLGVAANENPPTLRSHDRFGNRIDEVDFHPAWHALLEVATGHGLHSSPWAEPSPSGHAERAAGFYVWSQVEGGHGCPISMTYAAVPALRTDPAVAADWVPHLLPFAYDGTLRPVGEKPAGLAGMGMTEKQGGSDVRANTTTATPLAADGEYTLRGHKWFTSAPMNDLFLVLAQASGGLTCFVVPRFTPDGKRNEFRLMQLKNKLGNRSNASSEIEFDGTWAQRLGDEGRGVRTIIEMVNMTRLDCVIGSASLMRQAVAQATHHAAHRRAFGDYLIDKPLMQNVLADLAVESEAATTLMLRLAHAVDADESDFKRIALAVGKYWVCKRGVNVTAEALECLGGNGYVEDSGMPRLYREAPVNSIWEGSGNVNALDVLRAMGKEPQSVAAFFAELDTSTGADARLDSAVATLKAELADQADIELRARRVVERMALVLQGSLLVRFAPPAVSDAFCASRLGGDWGHAFGTLSRGVDVRAIVERSRPKAG